MNTSQQMNLNFLQLKEEEQQSLYNWNLQYMLIYQLLNIGIDIQYLILEYQDLLIFFILKLVLDVLVGIIFLIFSKKLNFTTIVVVWSLVKIYSAIVIIFTNYNYYFILLLIAQQSYLEITKSQITIQIIDTFGFMGCLIPILIVSQKESYFFIISSFLLSLFRCYYCYSFQKQKNKQSNSPEICNLSISQVSRFQQNDQHSCEREKWLERIEQIPISLLIISLSKMKITFKNSYFNQYFQKICKDEEEQDVLLLEKLKFCIIQYQTEDTRCGQSMAFSSKRKLLLRNRYSSTDQMENEDSQQTRHKSFSSKQSLQKILNKIKSGRLDQSIGTFQKTLDLYCQDEFEDITLDNNINSIKITLSGSLIINMEDDLVILSLNDISQQQFYQEEVINNQFKSHIVQSFSHELRTPLNSAINFLECSINDPSCSQQLKDQFIIPAQCGLRLQQYLINDIMDFQQLNNKNFEIDINQYKIKDIIDEINLIFNKIIEIKQLEFYINLVQNIQSAIFTDFNRLTQILVNLLQNAIKFSETGMIILKLKQVTNNRIRFSITDEGQGIPEDKICQIRKTLLDIQSNKSILNSQAWCGFGLAISQELLMYLSPDNFTSIEIFKRKRKGTKIIFYIEDIDPLLYSEQRKNLKSHSSKNSQMLQTLRSQNIKSNNQISQSFPLNGVFIQIHSSINVSTFQDQQSNQVQQLYFQNSNLSQLMEGRKHITPSLITDIIKDPTARQKQLEQPFNCIDYKSYKLQDDKESYQCSLQILNKTKCICRRILSVDDEIFNQQSIKLLLNQQGFEVITAYNGKYAIDLVQQTIKCNQNCQLFLLALMDYQMPVMDGVQTTRRLKELMENQIIPKFPIIGLTAFNSKSDINNCLNAGMIDVLNKPLKLKEFREVLSLI